MNAVQRINIWIYETQFNEEAPRVSSHIRCTEYQSKININFRGIHLFYRDGLNFKVMGLKVLIFNLVYT